MLLEISKICQTEADALLLKTQSIAQRITEALQASRACAQQKASEMDEADDVDSSNIEDVKGYFAEHRHRASQLHSDDNEHVVDPGVTISPEADVLITCPS